MVEIKEAVNVWVFFKKSRIIPYCFFWQGRQIKVNKINLIHTSKEGGKLFYHFSISSGGGFYHLKFDLWKLKWFLEQVEEKECL